MDLEGYRRDRGRTVPGDADAWAVPVGKKSESEHHCRRSDHTSPRQTSVNTANPLQVALTHLMDICAKFGRRFRDLKAERVWSRTTSRRCLKSGALMYHSWRMVVAKLEKLDAFCPVMKGDEALCVVITNGPPLLTAARILSPRSVKGLFTIAQTKISGAREARHRQL